MDEFAERPWERPGAVRRDCEPHRGRSLLILGNICLGCSVLLLGVLVLPVAIGVWILADRDLKLMAKGAMDPAGKRGTEVGLNRAIGSVVLAVATLGLLGARWVLAHWLQ